MKFRKTDKSYAEIAKELGGVGAFVAPTYLQVGNKLQVSAQLIRASDGSVLGAYKLDRKLEDILSLYGEIAQTIVGKIRVAVTQQEQQRTQVPAVRISVRRFDEAHRML